VAGRCASSVGHIPSNDGNEGWLHLQCQHGWNGRAATDVVPATPIGCRRVDAQGNFLTGWALGRPSRLTPIELSHTLQG